MPLLLEWGAEKDLSCVYVAETFFFRKFWVSNILDLAKTVSALQILSQKSNRNFEIKEF